MSSQATPEEMGAAPKNQPVTPSEYAELSANFNPLDQQELKRTGAALNALSLGKWQQLENLAVFFMAVLGVVTVSIEVFTRRNFGERYLTVVRILLGGAAMSTLSFIGGLFQSLGGITIGRMLANIGWLIFSLVPLILGFWHLHQIDKRNARGEAWYSYSFGESRLERLPFLARFNNWQVYRFIEPGVVFLLGIFCAAVLQYAPAAWWLIVGGFLMFLRNNAAYTTTRGLQLDLVDSQIMQAFVTPIMQGAAPAAAAGYAGIAVPTAKIAPTPQPTPQEQISAADMRAAAKAAMSRNKPTE